MATRGLLPSSSGHDRSHEPHRRSQAPGAHRSDRKLAGVCGGLARYFDIHPAVYPRRLRRPHAARRRGDPDLPAAALVMPERGARGLLRHARPAQPPRPALAADRPRARRGRARVAALAGDALAPRRRLDRAPDRGRRDPLDHPPRRSPAGATRADAATLASEDSRRIRRLVKRDRDRARHAVRARARGRRGRRGHVQRPPRQRRRRPQLRRRRHAGSPPLLQARDRRRCASTCATSASRAGETHVKARVDIGNLRVIVPQDVALQVRGDAQLGEVDILGESRTTGGSAETSFADRQARCSSSTRTSASARCASRAPYSEPAMPLRSFTASC